MSIVKLFHNQAPAVAKAWSTVCPERRRTTRVRGTTPRSHHADLTTSSLATRATASIVQNRCPRLPMSERPGTVVPGG